jgi:hypothetical protein
MMKFEQFLAVLENEDFDTKTVKDLAEIGPGDEIFQLGVWKTVEKVEGPNVTLVDETGKKSLVKEPEIQSRGVLVKVPKA